MKNQECRQWFYKEKGNPQGQVRYALKDVLADSREQGLDFWVYCQVWRNDEGGTIRQMGEVVGGEYNSFVC